ncbi:MAG: WecB/TagA/CpsF family glycosyltransferase, partial [Patescibacteria group bacterium]
GTPIAHRWTGTDFVWLLAEIAQERNQSLFLYGGFGDVPQRAAFVLHQRFPRLKIFGTENGTRSDGTRLPDQEIIERIQKKSPDVLLVALGAGRGEQGKQERWILEHQRALPSVKIAMGVGGAFDYLSGRVRRAPKWMRRIGLEWLFRLIQQPWRASRIFRATILFPLLVLFSREHESSH